jgi:hypothetical protein
MQNYSWYAPYYEAICETDDSLMPDRILEALSAIEERLLSPIELESEELRAIENAQTGLERLKDERVKPIRDAIATIRTGLAANSGL